VKITDISENRIFFRDNFVGAGFGAALHEFDSPWHIGLVVLISRSPQPSKIINCTTVAQGVACEIGMGRL
jgi:hypothetical protein